MHRTVSFAAIALALAPLASATGIYPKNSGVMDIMGKDFDKLIRNSANSSLVEFYAPWCGHCQNLKPAYIKAAQNLEGLANVAAVNCDDEENKPFCGSMRVQGFPTLKTVKVTGIIGKPIIQDYHGQRTAADMVETTKNLIPNYVDRVEQKDFDGWLQKKNDSAKAILFSNKGTTSALIKSLSNDYRGNMPVAQIRDKEKEINSMFGVTKYPTLVVLPGGEKSAVVYDGDMKKPAMSQFLGKYAKLRAESDKESKKDKAKPKESKVDKKASSSASSEFAEASASHASADASSSAAASASTVVLEEPVASESPDPIADKDAPPPVPVPDVAPPLPSLETHEDLQTRCLGSKTHTCLLAFLPPNADPEVEPAPEVTSVLASLAELAQKHKTRGDHLFPFYSVPASNSGSESVMNSLALPKTDGVQLIAVNGRRNWWRMYDAASKGFSDSAVEDWVDGIRLGEGKKNKLPEDLFQSATDKEAASQETATATPESEASAASEPADKTEASAESVAEPASEPTASAKETSTVIHEEL